jgi:GNAT superfamily N-acetyltransferase
VSAQIIDPIGDPQWSGLISGLRSPLFVSPRWLQVLADVYDLRAAAAVVEADGGFSAGVAYVVIDDPRRHRLTSLPFSDVAPIVCDTVDQWNELAAVLLGSDLPASFRTLGEPWLLADPRLRSTSSAVIQGLPLDEVPDFHPHARRHIGRADHAGLTFRPAPRCDLERFFHLHLRVRKERYRLLAQPFALFDQLWERYVAKGDGVLMLGYDGDQVAGGVLVVVEGTTAHYKFAASAPEYRRVGVNHAAAAAAIEWAEEEGMQWFDFGRSDLDQPGLVQFKRRLGAIAEPVYTHWWEPEGAAPADGAVDRTLHRLTAAFTAADVADATTRRAGELLYRFFA